MHGMSLCLSIGFGGERSLRWKASGLPLHMWWMLTAFRFKSKFRFTQSFVPCAERTIKLWNLDEKAGNYDGTEQEELLLLQDKVPEDARNHRTFHTIMKSVANEFPANIVNIGWLSNYLTRLRSFRFVIFYFIWCFLDDSLLHTLRLTSFNIC